MGESLRENVTLMLKALERRDLYGLLGVPRDATPAAITEAWRAAAQRVDPRSAGEPELAAAALRVRKALDDAKNTLVDPERRRLHDQGRSPAGVAPPRIVHDAGEDMRLAQLLMTPPQRLAGREVEVARLLHQRGAVLLSRGDAAGAERFYRRALELDPSVPTHPLRLGWVVLQRAGESPEALAEARTLIERAVAMTPHHAEARYAMARVWKALGDAPHYRLELEAAVRGTPPFPKAEMELAALKSAERRAAEAEAHQRRVEEANRGFSWRRLLGRDAG